MTDALSSISTDEETVRKLDRAPRLPLVVGAGR